MTEEIIIAGFGGQGVLSMGKILAYSGIMEGKEVSWMPSYGPEMRGGTANVTVIVSDERVCSPIINAFDTAVILNQQSLDKFESKVKPGGYLLYDPNGITKKPTRKDINIYTIEGAQLASDMGRRRRCCWQNTTRSWRCRTPRQPRKTSRRLPTMPTRR